MPLADAEQRYGAPYWVTHRGDLQAALAAAAARQLGINLKLGLHAEDFVAYRGGITVMARGRGGTTEERGVAFLAADGLWSQARKRLGHVTTRLASPAGPPGAVWSRRAWSHPNFASR